jgi:hypothetical protein
LTSCCDIGRLQCPQASLFNNCNLGRGLDSRVNPCHVSLAKTNENEAIHWKNEENGEVLSGMSWINGKGYVYTSRPAYPRMVTKGNKAVMLVKVQWSPLPNNVVT